MATSRADILSSLLTPADKQQALFSGLGALGAGLMQAGSPRVGQPGPGFGPGLLGFQQGIQQSRNNAIERALASQQLGLQERRIGAQERSADAALLKAATAGNKPLDSVAKLNADLKAGRITPEQHADRVKKLTGEGGLAALGKAFEKALDKGEAKEVITARKDASTALAITRATKNMLSDLEKSKGGAVSVTATVAKAGAAIRNEARQIAREFNVSLDPDRYDIFKDGALASQSAAFKSSALNLAILTARAEQGARLSDKDVELALERTGGGGRSPETVTAALVRNLQESLGAIEDRIGVTVPENARKGLLAPGALRKRVRTRLGRFGEVLDQTTPITPQAPAFDPATIDTSKISGLPSEAQFKEMRGNLAIYSAGDREFAVPLEELNASR